MGTVGAVTPRRVLRGVSGLVAGGLVVLLLILAGSWAGSAAAESAGPGAWIVIAHLVAATAAIILQRQADRREDRLGVAAAVGVLIVAGFAGVLWLN
jgi:hypothetical protein